MDTNQKSSALTHHTFTPTTGFKYTWTMEIWHEHKKKKYIIYFLNQSFLSPSLFKFHSIHMGMNKQGIFHPHFMHSSLKNISD